MKDFPPHGEYLQTAEDTSRTSPEGCSSVTATLSQEALWAFLKTKRVAISQLSTLEAAAAL